jgi:hypothetical protein
VVDDAWLATLPLVTAPPSSLHYRGRQLEATITKLRTAVRRDDPIEEYKVRGEEGGEQGSCKNPTYPHIGTLILIKFCHSHSLIR